MKRKHMFMTAAVAVLLIMGLHFFLPFLNGSEFPLVVLSGSMHPLMRVGDMVITESFSPKDLVVGDIITFNPPGQESIFVTHRILYIYSTDPLVFQTKGDANRVMDQFLVPEKNVIGKVVFVIPFAGYLPQLLKNKLVFALTLLLPASLLIIGEIQSIIKYSNPTKARKEEKKKRKMARQTSYTVHRGYLFTIICMSCIVLLLLLIPYISGNGQFTLQDGQKIENPGGMLSSVLVLTTENGMQISPSLGYAVITPSNSTIVHFNQETKISVSSVPYILPVFWVIALSQLHPLLPAFFILIFYTLLIVIISLPIWYRKTVRGKHISYRRMLFQLASSLHHHI